MWGMYVVLIYNLALMSQIYDKIKLIIFESVVANKKLTHKHDRFKYECKIICVDLGYLGM